MPFEIGAPWAAEMLARAKTVPIAVEIAPGITDRVDMQHVSLVKPHLPHTRRLSLSGSPASLASAVAHLNAPAPALKYIELAFLHSRSKFTPTKFFACQMPRLRALSLVDFSFSWRVKLPTTDITRLSITYGWGYDSSVKYDELLDFVVSIPPLDALYITRYLSASPKPDGATCVVSLPHLARLTLEGCHDRCLNVLQHLALPRSRAALDITLACGWTNTTPSSDLRAVLPRVCTHVSGAVPLHTLRIFETLRVGGYASWTLEVAAHAEDADLR
ncbi:hypothetical protein BV25DRAFT_1913110 [Artomyces pyxidatus]|uniref:Uncharacterized protein n=1 Tax=Artomyces pyxidatus TaxID=48021 RepID=A0ACB8TCJ4_9AGAM|nr:hypothetical protein BV25DRAFT_1913110 [Artomyces pyxidatus]